MTNGLSLLVFHTPRINRICRACTKGTRFTVRDGNRNREMAYDEIRKLYLNGPQQQLLLQFVAQVEEIKSQVESIHARFAGLEREIRKAD